MKLPIEFKQFLLGLSISMLMLLTACQSTGIVHKEYSNGEMVKKVAIYRGSVAMVTETKGLDIDYQGVKAKIDIYSNKGDADMINAVAKATLFVYTALQSGGTIPALSAVIQAINAPEASTNAPSAK
jgi:hypothetical protein